jgi:hypothetical protein
MPLTPHVIAETWLFTRLGQDAGAGGVAALAPAGVHANVRQGTSGFPYVVFQARPGGRPLQVVAGETIWTDLKYDIKAVLNRNDDVALDALVARIEARLHRQGAAGAVAVAGGGWLESCLNVGTLYYLEITDGVTYLHYGATYELKVSSS